MRELLARDQVHGTAATRTIPANAYCLCRDCSVYRLALG